MSIPIGVNFDSIPGVRFWFSPDIWTNMMTAVGPDGKLFLQTTLAQPYVSGSNVLCVSDPDFFSSNGSFPGSYLSSNIFMVYNSGYVNGTINGSVGSPYFHVTWQNPSMDMNYPSGTIVQSPNGYWTTYSRNQSDLQLFGEYVDASGRHTSYPAGLGPHQSLRLWVGNVDLPSGVYTLMADGNGSISYGLINKYTNASTVQTINVSSGVVSSPITITADQILDPNNFRIQTSDSGNPLHNVRLIMDGFQNIYLQHKGDPNFFMLHPKLLEMLKPFSVIRFMDTLLTNNTPTSEWNKPVNNGTCIGLGVRSGFYEWLVQMCVEANCDMWWCVPHDASDDYVAELANFIQNELFTKYPNSTIKFIVEYSNEVWNWGFGQAKYATYMYVLDWLPFTPQRITCERNKVNVRMPNHGFTNGSLVQVENCDKDIFNGCFQISYTDKDNFSYSIAPNASWDNVIPKHHHKVAVLNVNSPNCHTIKSMQWDGYHTITVVTNSPHNLVGNDMVQIANASDPAFNQLWSVIQVNDSYTFVVFLNTEGFKRSIPVPVPGLVVNAVSKDGNPMRLWKLAEGKGGTTAITTSAFNALNYYAKRSAEINQILYSNLINNANRLGFVLAWQCQSATLSTYNAFFNLLSLYKQALGGAFLPNSEISIACAPYFGPDNNNLFNLYNAFKPITSISNSGTLAVVSSANHGYSNGDSVGIFNVTANYGGIRTVNVIDSATFSYDIGSTGVAPGKSFDSTINQMMAIKNPPYFREITQVSATGNQLHCSSYNHGFADQSQIYLCNAPENYYHSPLNGLFTINVIDSGNFSVSFDNTRHYTLSNNVRLWAYPPSAVSDRLSLYNPQSGILRCLPNMQLAASANPPVTLRCYESGFGDTAGWRQMTGNLPPYLDMLKQTVLSDKMEDIYKQYYTDIHDKYGVQCANHYNFVDTWSKYGFWGLTPSVSDPATPRWKALAYLSGRMPIPSGNWVTNATVIPYFSFDSGVPAYNVNMTLTDVDTSTVIPGSTVVNFPNAYFQPSGAIVTNNYTVTCDATNSDDIPMSTQSVNVKITIGM